MDINFIVKDSVKVEVVEIVDWYNYKQTGLGERFYRKFTDELEVIKKRPNIYRYYNKEFRRAVLKNFPYLIIFKVTATEIVIYSVIYGGRNPDLINKRIS